MLIFVKPPIAQKFPIFLRKYILNLSVQHGMKSFLSAVTSCAYVDTPKTFLVLPHSTLPLFPLHVNSQLLFYLLSLSLTNCICCSILPGVVFYLSPWPTQLIL